MPHRDLLNYSQNVVSFETILANGTIVDVNSSNHPDLFFALKGGGNQFGIVTRFTLKTYPMGQVWGGYRTYTGGKAPALMKAVRTFTENYPDPKAAIIVTAERVLDINMWLMFFFYDGPEVPKGVFDEFLAISHITDSTKTRSYADLLVGNDKLSLTGQRYLIRVRSSLCISQNKFSHVDFRPPRSPYYLHHKETIFSQDCTAPGKTSLMSSLRTTSAPFLRWPCNPCLTA
jgi:hypothetical protein